MPPFKQNWDAPGIYRDLLVALTTEHPPSTDALRAVTAAMNAKGYQFNMNGLKQHLQKLRRADADAGGAAAVPSPRTPRTKGRAAKTTTPATTPRKRANKGNENENVDEHEDDGDDAVSPSKKMKKEAADIDHEFVFLPSEI